MKKHKSTIILILIFCIGLSLLLYPTASDYWNSFHQSRAIAEYAESVADINKEKYEELYEGARVFNESLVGKNKVLQLTEEETEAYNSLLNVTSSGIMGYVDIPKIKCTLPIYHGTSEAVLQIAVGHLEGSSFPIGGESTHCVISGHRGLPSARLFTDLDKLAEGDVFLLQTLNNTMTYEVDQIRIVEPTDISNLTIEEGKDYCTLITCTPYGINTHRLLVRGHRIANANGEAHVTADAIQIDTTLVALTVAVPLLVLMLLWIFITSGRKKGTGKSHGYSKK